MPDRPGADAVSFTAAVEPTATGQWLGVAVLAVLVLAAVSDRAHAFCSIGGPGDIVALQQLVGRNPREALAQIDRRLADRPGPVETAWLRATQAGAFDALEEPEQLQEAAAAGFAALGDRTDPVRLQLLIDRSIGLDDPDALDRAIRDIGAASRTLPEDSDAALCALGTVGLLELWLDRTAASTRDSTEAYERALRTGSGALQAALTYPLATVLSRAGDWDGALSVNEQAIDYDRRNGLSYSLALNLVSRASFLARIGRDADALAAVREAAALNRRIGDDHGVAYDELQACKALVALDRPAEARAACDEATRLGVAAIGPAVAQDAAVVSASVDVAQGRYGDAIARLSHGFDEVAAMSGGAIRLAHKVRAEALAGAGRFAEAYAELERFQVLDAASNRRATARQTAALRARADADRLLQSETELRRQIALDRARHRVQLRWLLTLCTAAALVIALLLVILLNLRRHRVLQTRLADEDPLTGLFNRRAITRCAEAALASPNRATSIVLADLDHFKSINDRFGHPAGDAALRIFAREARAALGDRGVVGRWGGEEFLFVVPDGGSAAAALMDALRTSLLGVTVADAPGCRIGFSAGIACQPGEGFAALCRRADQALYQAKMAGRGRSWVVRGPDRRDAGEGAGEAVSGEQSAA